MKRIVNYTTQIKSEKTIAEIEAILVEHGASYIYKMYESGECKGLAFKYMFQDKLLSFVLPMNADAIYKLMVRLNIPPKFRTEEQARRTGWRIIKQWVQSQMALIEIKAVSFEQVFLAYVYEESTGLTFYDRVIEKKLLLD